MPLRSLNSQSLQNYPKIQIDRGSVIKPCIANQVAADQFIDRPASSWKKMLYDVWHDGIPYLLRHVSSLKEPTNSNTYYKYFIRFLKYIALLMLHIHEVYLYVFGYFYPYSLLSVDELCDEFSPCPKWSESVIRAFAWHPNHDRCALAICNDYIYVYEGSYRIRVLRHNHQRKIVALAWQPNNKEVLVVATQTSIILWRVAENQVHSIKSLENSSLTTYLAPGTQMTLREKEDSRVKTCEKSIRIIENILPPPIVSIMFDHGGTRLFACSPSSSKIAILDIDSLFNDTSEKQEKHIEYLRKLGQGITKLLWSPEFNRLATATTSNFVRVFEPFNWTFHKWTIQGSVIQDIIWSRPSGRMMLIANKDEPYLYVLPFLDSPQANDVGGNKSLMKALDLTSARNEGGELVGGRIQSLAWDKNGKRLAITSKDNPQYILLYRTIEKPTLQIHQLGVIQSENGSHPLLLEFHDKYKTGALLTICWSDGNCQHVPLCYTPQEQTQQKEVVSPNQSIYNTTSPKRSLTDFCLVSGNKKNSINLKL